MTHADQLSTANLTSSPSFVVTTGKAGAANQPDQHHTSSSDPQQPNSKFVDRRSTPSKVPSASERRQFGNSHHGLSDDGQELALAIDRYKVTHHRRYLTCDEMLNVLCELGYRKS